MQVIGRKGVYQCREYPFVNGYMWHTEPHSLEYERPLSEETFYAFSGIHPFIEAAQYGFNPRHYMVLEDSRLLGYMPEGFEVLVLSRKSEISTRFCLAAEALSKWINDSILPARQPIHVNDDGVEYEFRTSDGKGVYNR